MDLRLLNALTFGSLTELVTLLDSEAVSEEPPQDGNTMVASAATTNNHTAPTMEARIDIPSTAQEATTTVNVRFVPRLLELRLRILQGVTPTGDGALHIAARNGRHDQVRAIFIKAGVLLGEHEAVQAAGRENDLRPPDERGVVAEASTDTAGADHQQRPTVQTTTTAEASTMLFGKFLRTRNKRGETCLHEAVRSNSKSMVELLLAVDAKVRDGTSPGEFLRARNEMGETCLHEAIRCNSKSLVDLLLAVDANVRGATSPALLQILDHDGTSPLYLATTLRRVDIINAFIDKNNMYTVSSAGPQGRTALHAAVLLSKDLCDSLLKWNTGLAKRGDNYGRTPIHYLGTTGTDIVDLLLQYDCSTGYCADSDGWLPLHVAASRGRLDIVRMLVKKCPDCILSCNTSGQTFLHVAVHNGHNNVVGYASRKKRLSNVLNMRDLNGDTALHVAVEKGDEFIFWRLLRNKNVCLSFINRKGQTPLDLAILGIEAASKLKYKWEWIRDDLVYTGADLSCCRWDDLKDSKIRWDYGPMMPINIMSKIRGDGPTKFIREVLWDYPIKLVHEKTDNLIFSGSTIPERDDDTESERLGKAAAVLAAGALLILTLSFQAPLNASDKKPHSTDESRHTTTKTFVRLVPVDTVSMAAAVLSIFFCTIAGFPTRRFWIRSKALLIGGILLGAAAVSILLVFSLGLSLVYDYPRWWIVALVYGVITVVTLLSFSFFTNQATRAGSPRQVLAWVLARCQRCGILNFGFFMLQQFGFIKFLPFYAAIVLVAIWFLFMFLVK